MLVRTSQAKRLPINERIRWARKRKGLSLDKLAAATGTSRRHLIRLEKGEHNPGPRLRARIALATDQPADFLSNGDDDEEEDALVRDLILVMRRLISHERTLGSLSRPEAESSVALPPVSGLESDTERWGALPMDELRPPA